MKNVILKSILSLGGLFLIVSFQNCSKVRPEILVNDKLTSQGAVNSDEIATPAEIPVEIGEVPSDDEDRGQEVVDNPGNNNGNEESEEINDEDMTEEDLANCQDKKKGHHIVLDAQNNVYDGDLEKRGGGVTYISVKDGSVAQEIQNTQGKQFYVIAKRKRFRPMSDL